MKSIAALSFLLVSVALAAPGNNAVHKARGIEPNAESKDKVPPLVCLRGGESCFSDRACCSGNCMDGADWPWDPARVCANAVGTAKASTFTATASCPPPTQTVVTAAYTSTVTTKGSSYITQTTVTRTKTVTPPCTAFTSSGDSAVINTAILV